MNRYEFGFVDLKILVMGGTRFVGKALVSEFISQGHSVTLFTRGNNCVPSSVIHIKGDRSNLEDLSKLKGYSFDVIVDSSGRSLEDTQKVISIVGNPAHRLIYISSAGVYLNKNIWPLDESSDIDPNSRHIGKALTENWLINENISFTSFRPTYIYGPGNYNPIEKWFFDRILNNQPVPIPINSSIITQLGHVSDLSSAIIKSLDLDIANNKIYNCTGHNGITLLGLVDIAASACGEAYKNPSIRYFDHTILDKKARKVFPLRLSHYLVDTHKIEQELDWKPRYDLLEGFIDSYKNDYLLNVTNELDFSLDDTLKLVEDT